MWKKAEIKPISTITGTLEDFVKQTASLNTKEILVIQSIQHSVCISIDSNNNLVLTDVNQMSSNKYPNDPSLLKKEIINSLGTTDSDQLNYVKYNKHEISPENAIFLTLKTIPFSSKYVP